MGRPPRTRNKNAIAIRQRSEGVKVALRYLRNGHTDLALQHLEAGLVGLEDLAGGQAATLRVAQRFLLDGLIEMGRAWLEKGIEQLGEVADGYTARGKERFEASEKERHAQMEREHEEAKVMMGRGKCQ